MEYITFNFVCQQEGQSKVTIISLGFYQKQYKLCLPCVYLCLFFLKPLVTMQVLLELELFLGPGTGNFILGQPVQMVQNTGFMILSFRGSQGLGGYTSLRKSLWAPPNLVGSKGILIWLNFFEIGILGQFLCPNWVYFGICYLFYGSRNGIIDW